MKIFKYLKGTSRTVILVFPLGLVFKFPQWTIKKPLKDTLKFLKLFYRCFLKTTNPPTQIDLATFHHYSQSIITTNYEDIFSISYRLFRGVMANRNERLYFKTMKSSFLIPTYFSFFGLVNIQPLAKVFARHEHVYTLEIYTELRKMITKDDLKKFDRICLHHFIDGNFAQRKDGSIALFDYGNTQLVYFIEKYGESFSKVFQNTQPIG